MSVKLIVKSMPSIICSTKKLYIVPAKVDAKICLFNQAIDCSSSSPPLSPTLLFSSQVLKNLALLKSLNLHQISLQQIEKSFLRLLVLLHALILVVLVLIVLLLLLLLLLLVLVLLLLLLLLLFVLLVLLLVLLLLLLLLFPPNYQLIYFNRAVC